MVNWNIESKRNQAFFALRRYNAFANLGCKFAWNRRWKKKKRARECTLDNLVFTRRGWNKIPLPRYLESDINFQHGRLTSRICQAVSKAISKVVSPVTTTTSNCRQIGVVFSSPECHGKRSRFYELVPVPPCIGMLLHRVIYRRVEGNRKFLRASGWWVVPFRTNDPAVQRFLLIYFPLSPIDRSGFKNRKKERLEGTTFRLLQLSNVSFADSIKLVTVCRNRWFYSGG